MFFYIKKIRPKDNNFSLKLVTPKKARSSGQINPFTISAFFKAIKSAITYKNPKQEMIGFSIDNLIKRFVS